MRDTMVGVSVLAILLVASAICAIRLAESPNVTANVTTTRPLKPPTTGQINVAFIISKGADVIDIAGAWEVFEDTMLTSKGQPWQGGDDMVMPFNVYTVSDSMDPIGASMPAAYGLLDGEAATTHHMYERGLQQRYPAVHFVNGVRFVENDKISTAAGLTSGIDLALHVVERYFGQMVAQSTADYMEYHGELWENPELATTEMKSASK